MELTACVLALEKASRLPEIKKISRIVIYTDSMYIVDNINNAKYVWPKQNWMTKTGPPVLNAETWKKLTKNISKIGMRVDIEYVEGHSKDLDNRAVDKLARRSALKAKPVLGSSKIVRRKKTTEETVRGSIKMEGQHVTISIIESEYLKTQDTYKLRYEILSRRSAFFRKVDFIFSKKPLKAGHIFRVRLNKDSNYPQIEKIFKVYKNK